MVQVSMEFDDRERESYSQDPEATETGRGYHGNLPEEDEEDTEDQDYDPADEVPEFNFEDLNENSDRELVRDGIIEKYGFTPSDEYVEDLIIFVTQMTKGS